MHSAKTERDMGKKVTPAHDKIHVDKKLYAWEDVTNRRVQWSAGDAGEAVRNGVRVGFSVSNGSASPAVFHALLPAQPKAADTISLFAVCNIPDKKGVSATIPQRGNCSRYQMSTST